MKISPFLLLFSLAVCHGATTSAAPNILLILTDDQGFGDVSNHGNEWIATPNMVRIAEEGARFERFFVEPVCAPTRAALLSGRYPTRTGVHGVTRNREIMRGEEVTIAELLRDEAGYATGCFGKWHNGAHWPYHPNAQGFKEFVGFCGGHWNDYYDPILERNGEPLQTRGFIADVLTDKAIEFIEEKTKTERPFFCYLPYNTPHTPASVPADDWNRWRNREDVEDPFTRTMYALCENIDTNIGRLLEKLDELKIADNTVVLFLTDNGPNGERYNGGMLGRKGSEHEGGIRVPLFVRWPGKIKPGTVIEPNVAHIDLLPTLCGIAGVEDLQSKTEPLDGVDISPLLLGDPDFKLPKRHLFTWRNSKRWSVRSAQYRATAKTLHDLWNDPGQQIDLSKEKPALHRELVHIYQGWAAGAVPSAPQPLPVQIGHARQLRLTIKAHEFEIYPAPGKGIDYCEGPGFANQWIEDWTDPEAWAECPVKIVEGGRYRVSFRYAGPAEAAGSIFRLEAGGSSLEFKITEPWVSAVYPASEQFSQRKGGYLSREWKDIEIGVIELKAGEFPLQLLAVRKTGDAMPDFKAVIFEKALIFGFAETDSGFVWEIRDSPVFFSSEIMRLLLTNDDGIDAPGIAALERACESSGHELTVVAPAEPASQIGHRVTTDTPIAVERQGERRFAVAGTPADCVRLALSRLLDQPPDYVISGVNYGGNLGLHDLHISGTVAAVREAVLHGIPGAAISNYHRADLEFCWDTAARRTRNVLASLLEESLGDHEFWNVNLPHTDPDLPEPEMRRCEPERHPLPVAFTESDDSGAFQYSGRYHERGRSEGSDVAICFGGDIAVTRVRL